MAASRDYFIYVSRQYPCLGIGRGSPEDLYSTISEVIETYRNPSRQQHYSTSRDITRTFSAGSILPGTPRFTLIKK